MRSRFSKKNSGGGKGGKSDKKDPDKDKEEPPSTDLSKSTTSEPSKSTTNNKTPTKNLGSVSRIRDLDKQTQHGLNRFGDLATQYSDDESSNGDGSFLPVDADTAVNDTNKTSNPYFSSVVADNILYRFDYTDRYGTRHRCLSLVNRAVARMALDSTDESSDDKEIIPDSGATSHMFHSARYFTGDYTRCANSFVVVGDGQRIPVQGYGTARIKIDGKVIVLPNALHVPGLESNLFSATRHGSNGDGCAFIISNGTMHLSFPTFSITRPVPSSGNLRVSLDKMTANDWIFNDFECGLQQMELFDSQVDFLNRVYFGRAVTRAQKKQKLNKLRAKLQQHADETRNAAAEH